MLDTLIVTVKIQDGDNRYYENKIIKVDVNSMPSPDRDQANSPCPTEDFVMKRIYDQNLLFDEYSNCWDLSSGSGYPLAQIYSWYLVKPEHINILKEYGID